MLYYRAKNDVYDYKKGFSLIRGELLTKRERQKYYSQFSDNAFEVVNISKSRTFINFGVRFEIAESDNGIYLKR